MVGTSIMTRNVVDVALMCAFLGCGDNTGGPVPDFEPACETVPFTSEDQFSKSTDFPPVVGYTLEGADLEGRWLRAGEVWTSLYVERTDDEIVLERGIETESDASEIFATLYVEPPEFPTGNGWSGRRTWRISNRAEDGTMRFDGAWCEGDECEVCSAKMIRMERFDAQE